MVFTDGLRVCTKYQSRTRIISGELKFLNFNLKTTPHYNSNVLWSLVVLYKRVICELCTVLPDESHYTLTTNSFRR
ncbi:unnamed protein product [Schistosoma rodhaini]|uniref:Uncharacterized protein n=1 Tax=Schistosoma rodhaini TaxID=6188 RepID=A0AA85GCC2_9TREM|nr:unnamed protein product [Schistosoma rodhaini]